MRGVFREIKKTNETDPVHKTIVDFLMSGTSDEEYIDFVAVGNNGADFSHHSDTKYLG